MAHRVSLTCASLIRPSRLALFPSSFLLAFFSFGVCWVFWCDGLLPPVERCGFCWLNAGKCSLIVPRTVGPWLRVAEPASGALACAMRCLFLHSLFDLPSEWYVKTRQSVQQFTVCQIGESDVQLFVMDCSRRFFFFYGLGFSLLFDHFQRHYVSFCVLVLFSSLFLFVVCLDVCVYHLEHL